MRTIGLCIATIEGGTICHQEIGREAARRGIAYPDIVTHTPLYDAIGRANATGDFAALAPVLVASMERLAKAGAAFAAIPSNTMHVVFDAVAAASPIPLLNLLDVTADRCKAAGVSRVGILGTELTMTRRLYDRPLAERGIATVYPDRSERDALNRIICDELIHGIFRDTTIARLDEMARRLSREAEVLVLGCTELPLVMTETRCGVKLVDTTRVLAHAALDAALA